MTVLGIETSCDETAVALVDERGVVSASQLSSQTAAHQPFGGVVPEIAARHHLQALPPLLHAALAEAGTAPAELAAIAVTAGPGLIGALLVGVSFAKAYAWGLGVPVVGINHLEGHVFSAFLHPGGEPADVMPERFLALVVSGGHSTVVRVENGRLTPLNRTRDDAPGEVFDKIGKRLGLGYPGGPVIDRLSERGDRRAFRYAIPTMRERPLDYSFSGLKSAVLRDAERLGLATPGGTAPPVESWGQSAFDLLASFQEAVCDILLDRLGKIVQPADRMIALSGGVAANRRLRERVSAWGAERRIAVALPHPRLTTDNAAMIAFAGAVRIGRGERSELLALDARSRWDVGGIA